MAGNGGTAEAERWLVIAEKLLAGRDLLGSKTFAIRARESDPRLDRSERILAVVDTLLAGISRINDQHDWYGVLQLVRGTHDPRVISTHYARLAFLLSPATNNLPFADLAFRLVSDAFSVLSNPSKKLIYDQGLSLFSEPTSHEFQLRPETHFLQPQPQLQPLLQSPSQPQPQPQLQPFLQPLLQRPSPQLLQPPSPLLQQPPQPTQPQPRSQLSQQLLQSRPQSRPQSQPQPQSQSRSQPQPQPQSQPQPQPQSQSQSQSQSQPQSQPQPQPQPQPQSQSQPQPQPQPQPNVRSSPRAAKNTEKPVNESVSSSAAKTMEPEVPSFWTACPYCFNLYEYPKVYEECSLLCQNCKRAFHGVVVPPPPGIVKGRDSYFCCWGFYPLGFLEPSSKKKATASKKVPRVYIDDDDDFLDVSDPSEDSDDDDWGSHNRKKKKARNVKRRGSGNSVGRPRKGVQSSGGGGEVKGSAGKVSETRFAVQEGVGVVNVAANVTKLEMGKKVTVSNSKRQTAKAAKDLGKLDLNVEFSNEVEEPTAKISVNGEEEGMEGIGFFEGLDEFLSSLPILSVMGDEKVKAAE